MNLDECLIPNCTCKAKARSHTFSKSMLQKRYKEKKLYGHFPTINTSYLPQNHELRYIPIEKVSRCVGLCTNLKENRENESEMRRLKNKKGLNIPKDKKYIKNIEMFCDDILYSLFERRKMIEKGWLIEKESGKISADFSLKLNFINKYNLTILNIFTLRGYIYLYRFFESLSNANTQKIPPYILSGYEETEIPILLKLSKEKVDSKINSIYENIELLLELESIEYYLGYDSAFRFRSDDLAKRIESQLKFKFCYNQLNENGLHFYSSTQEFRHFGGLTYSEQINNDLFPESLGILIDRNKEGVVRDFYLTAFATFPSESAEDKKHFSQFTIMDYEFCSGTTKETKIKFIYLNNVFSSLIKENRIVTTQVKPQKNRKQKKKQKITKKYSTYFLYSYKINRMLINNSIFFLYQNKESFERMINGYPKNNPLEYSTSLDSFILDIETMNHKYSLNLVPFNEYFSLMLLTWTQPIEKNYVMSIF